MQVVKRPVWEQLQTVQSMLMLAAAIFLINQSLQAQPSWEVAAGGPNLETAHRAIEAQTPGFAQGVLAVGGTDSFGARFRSSPPNLYITYTDQAGSGVLGYAMDIQTWDIDYSIVELPEFEQFVATTGAWNENTGSYDIAIICMDYDGNLQWSQWYGSYGKDGGTSIIRMKEGQFADQLIVAGIYENANGDNDGVIIRLLDDGTPQTSTRIDLSQSFNSNDRLFCVREDVIEGAAMDQVYAVGATNAVNTTPDDDDVWLLHFNLDTQLEIFSRVYDGDNSNDRGYSLTMGESPDFQNGWVITMAGESQQVNYTSRNDAFVIRTDYQGQLGLPGLYAASYNIEPSNSWDVAYSIDENLAGDGGVVVVGQTNGSTEIDGSGFAMELDNFGNVVFANTYGRLKYETLRSVYKVEGVGYYYGGITYSDGIGGGDQWLLFATPQLNTGAHIESSEQCAIPASPTAAFTLANFPANGNESVIPTAVAPSIEVVTAGELFPICFGPPSPAPPPITTEVEFDGVNNDASKAFPIDGSTLIMSPNPVRSGDDIAVGLGQAIPHNARISVTDALGRPVFNVTGRELSGRRSLNVNTEGWSSGAYSLSITSGDKIESTNFIVLD